MCREGRSQEGGGAEMVRGAELGSLRGVEWGSLDWATVEVVRAWWGVVLGVGLGRVGLWVLGGEEKPEIELN